MRDTSDSSGQNPLALALRAVFVPDGEGPPMDLAGTINPLRLRATLDPATGALTCDITGMNRHGDLSGEWVPDSAGESGDDASPGTDRQTPMAGGR